MNNNLTEIACVVDRSGSMQSIASDAIGGFNSFLTAQQEHPGEAKFTLVLFNDAYKVLHDGADIQSVPLLDEATYVPAGTTALLDAVGRTIDALGQRLDRTPEASRPGTVIVAILTDGLENASKEYSRQRVAEMIEHQRQYYSWEFIFLAANQDAITAAGNLSIRAKDAMSFEASAEGIRSGYQALSAMVSKRRGSSG